MSKYASERIRKYNRKIYLCVMATKNYVWDNGMLTRPKPDTFEFQNLFSRNAVETCNGGHKNVFASGPKCKIGQGEVT